MKRQARSQNLDHTTAAAFAHNENASVRGNRSGRRSVNSDVQLSQFAVDPVVIAPKAVRQDSCPTPRTLSRAAAVAAAAKSAISAPSSPASQSTHRREDEENNSFSGPKPQNTAHDRQKRSLDFQDASSSGWQASDELPSASALVEVNSPAFIDNQGIGNSNSDSIVRKSQETKHDVDGSAAAEVGRLAMSHEVVDPFNALARAVPPSIGDDVSEELLLSPLLPTSSQHPPANSMLQAPAPDWTCSVCTYANGALDSLCLMCDSPRPRGVKSNGKERPAVSGISVRTASASQKISPQPQESIIVLQSNAPADVPQPPAPPSSNPLVRDDDKRVLERLKGRNISAVELNQTEAVTRTGVAVEVDIDGVRRGGSEAEATTRLQPPSKTTTATHSLDAASIVNCSDCRRSMPLANLELHRLRCPKVLDQRAKDKHRSKAHAMAQAYRSSRTPPSNVFGSKTTSTVGVRSTQRSSGTGNTSTLASAAFPAGVVPDNVSAVSKEVGPPSPPPQKTSPSRATASGYVNNLNSLRPPPAGSPSAGRESNSSHNSSTSGSRRSSGLGGSTSQGGSASGSKRWSPEKPWGAPRGGGGGAGSYAPKPGHTSNAKNLHERQCASEESNEIGGARHSKTTNAKSPPPGRPLPSYMRSTATSKSRQQRP